MCLTQPAALGFMLFGVRLHGLVPMAVSTSQPRPPGPLGLGGRECSLFGLLVPGLVSAARDGPFCCFVCSRFSETGDGHHRPSSFLWRQIQVG